MAHLFYPATSQSQCLLEIGRDGALSTLCNSYGFACQKSVQKTFLGPEYFCSAYVVV